MMNEQTITAMNAMKLFGMAKAFPQRLAKPDHADLSHAEFVGLLVEDEKSFRDNARLARLLKKARLRQSAALEDIDLRHSRGLTKQLVLELSAQEWMAHHQNVLITGPTGIGKSYLACALGNHACRSGYTTNYLRFPRLLENLYASRGDGTHLKLLERLAKVHILILDDFGMSPLSDFERKDFLEIIEDRYGAATTIITTQVPIKDWHQVIGDPTIADAICDRLLHKAFRIELKGDSMRKRNEK
jgi:DNA replication protein DnaC